MILALSLKIARAFAKKCPSCYNKSRCLNQLYPLSYSRCCTSLDTEILKITRLTHCFKPSRFYCGSCFHDLLLAVRKSWIKIISLILFFKKYATLRYMEAIKIPNKDKLLRVMLRNQIEFAAFFGSRVKGTSKKNSDYDILVEFSPKARVGLFKYQLIENEISSALGGRVDLVTVGGIDKYIKDEVFNTMKVIYDNRSER